MSKIGRPKLKETIRKGVVSTLRLAEAERAEMDAAAQAAGTTFSKWARDILLDAARKKL